MRATSKARMIAAAVHATVIATATAVFAQRDDSASAPAVTSPSGSDTIATKNGGMLRGTVVEVVLDVEARIQLLTGEVVAIPWAQIERIEHGASAPTPVERPALMPSEVWVHLEAPDGVIVRQAAPLGVLLPGRRRWHQGV